MADYKGEFENWCDKWDQAQQEGIFDDMPEQEVDNNQILGFGTTPRDEDIAPQDFTPTPSQDSPELLREEAGVACTEEEFGDYVSKWEKAQKEGIFEDMPGVTPQEPEGGASAQDSYWKNFEREAQEKHEHHAGTPTSKADLAHQSKDMARAANPVHHNTVGLDQKLDPWTPNWIDGKELIELAELKVDLYDLEVECGKKDGLGESASSVEAKIKAIWEKINTLSSNLTPNRFQEILD